MNGQQIRTVENEELVENTECEKWGIGVKKNLKIKKFILIKTCKTLVIGSAMLFES